MTKREKNRALQLESLENRMLLSAVPVNLPDVQPAGTGAVCWTRNFDLQGHETYEIEFQTKDLDTLSVFCINSDGVSSSIDFDGSFSTSSNNVMKEGVSVENVDSISYTLSNQSESQGNYTLIAFSGSSFETELQYPLNVNDLRSSAQEMSVTTVGTMKQSVLIGQLTPYQGENDTDCYSFQTGNGNLSIQLHTDTASALTFELYASETAEKPIAYATNIDDFTSLVNSASVASNSRVYIRVHASEGAEVSAVNYTLTVTDGASVNTSTNVDTLMVNCLTSNLFIGQMDGSDRDWAAVSKVVENGKIRAINSDGNQMAVVSYDSSTFSATVALWTYAGSSWTEMTSTSFLCTSSNLDVSICGDSILVGNKDANSAYLFTLEDGELVQTDLTVNSLPEGAKFGTAVQLSEKTLFVSAPKNGEGVIYVFEKGEENWSLSQTLTQGTVTNFGSKMVFDAEQNRLCVISSGSLFFYKQSSNGSWNLESTLTGDSVTNFGSAAALEGSWLAVACQKNSRWVVQIYNWKASTQNWVWMQDVESQEEEPSFGRSLSFANGQLAVSSLANTGEALVGTVHLYRCVSSGNSPEWKFVQTYDGSTSVNFGKTVLLSADRMDVLDFDGNSVATLTNYSNGDSWNLNVTSAGTKVEFLITKSESETGVLILAPDGSAQAFTKTTEDDGVSVSFTPSRTGTYKVRLFSDVTRSYLLYTTSSSLAPFSSGMAAEPVERSNEVIVEYAQQILVSSLDSATAIFRDGNGKVTNLAVQGILNGNQVVWIVPETVPNGEYTLYVSGLKSVSKSELDPVSVENYNFSGAHTLLLESVGSEGSSIKRGELEVEPGTAFEILDLSEEEAERIDFRVEGLEDYTIERSYDPVNRSLQVCILSLETTERVLIQAVLNASFASDEDLVPGSSVVGTLAASGEGKTQTLDLALESGQSVNLALTVTDPASQEAVKMELFDSEGTLLAVNTLLAGDSASQWITTLKNTSPAAANYTVKLTNQTSGTADYTLEVISAQAPATATAQFNLAGQYFLETFSSVSLEFSENVDLSTLAPSDFQLWLDGETQTEYYVRACQVQDGTHVVLTFNAPLADGVWTLGLAGNGLENESIQTLSGTDFALSAAVFCIDTTNPAVESITFGTDSGGRTRIYVKFSEAVQEATPTLTGKIYGQVGLVSGEGSYNQSTNTWMLTTNAVLPSDFYTFSISNIKDLAGNVTETETTKGLAITFASAETVTNVVSTDPSTGWLPQYMDGSQAFVHQILGCVTQNHSASFVLDGIEDGEQIAFSFMSPAGYSDPCWNDHIKAEWNAATKTVTIRYDASAHSGGLTEQQSAQATADLIFNGQKSGVFVMYILRNANYENADFTDPMDVQLSELGEKTDAQGNVQKIRQTSAMGTISSAGDSDVYRFTLDGKSTIFAGLTINSGVLGGNANFKIQLYEELPDGTRGPLLAEANSSSMGEKVSDTLNVWIENVRNHSDEAQTYQLVVSATNVSASGALYTLVLTENAVFNAEKYTTADTITELYDTNSAVGHVSSAIAGFTSAGIYNSLDSASSAVYGDYIFVGDSANNQVLIYEPNAAGTALEQVGTVKTTASVSGDGFGATLVLNGTTLAVSAPAHSNGNGTTGSVYLFDLDSINAAGNSTPSQTITNPGNSHDFGLIMDYSESLGLLVVGSQTAYQMSYLFDLSDGETTPTTYNLTQILAGYVNLELEADGQTPVIQNNQLSWSEEWSNFGYSVAIDDAGLVVVGAPLASTYSTYNQQTNTWSTESGSNGMVFVLAMNGSSMRLTEDSDLRFGYSVTSENGVLVAASAPGDYTSGIALHTFDFRKASPSDERFVLTDLVISENIGALPQAVQLREGFLYVTGAISSNPDAQLTLCSSSVWPYDTQMDVYHFTADGSSISVAFTSGLRGDAEDLEVALFDKSGTKIQGTVQNGTLTFSTTAGSEYFLHVDTVNNAECDYVMTVQGIAQNDYSFGLTEDGVKVNGKAVSETLTTRPTTVTFTLEKPVRADLISKSSVQIDGVSASSFALSADGKTATFSFAYKQFTETTATLTIRAEDFCTVDGSILALTDAEAAQTLTLAQSSVEQKIRAREDSLEATWTFEENLKNANANVTILKKAKGSDLWVNITSTGTLTRQGKVLKWTAGSVLAGTDDQISIFLDSSSVSMISGCPVEQLDAMVQTINLNVQGETSLVVRKTSSIDETVEAGGASRQEIPASEKWIDEWQNIWVEVWASVLSATENGLKSYSAEISYDPVKFNPVKNGNISVKYDSTLFSSVTVTKVANENKLQIQATVKAGLETVGVCDLDGVGDHVLLGSIQFYGQKDGVHLSETYAIQGEAIGIQIVENSVVLQDTNETVVAAVENTTQDLPLVYPVVYDLDDSGTVDINDLVTFARVFAQTAVPFTVSGVADFNAGGSVEINDLVLFARNFGKKEGSSIIYADALTKNWGNALAQGAALPEAAPAALPTSEPTAALSVPEPVALPVSEPAAALSESTRAFQISFGNVYVNDWTAQAPDFQKQIEEENALRAELLEEVLPQTVEKKVASTSSDEAFELDSVWDELKKEEADELDVTLGKMIF